MPGWPPLLLMPVHCLTLLSHAHNGAQRCSLCCVQPSSANAVAVTVTVLLTSPSNPCCQEQRPRSSLLLLPQPAAPPMSPQQLLQRSTMGTPQLSRQRTARQLPPRPQQSAHHPLPLLRLAQPARLQQSAPLPHQPWQRQQLPQRLQRQQLLWQLPAVSQQRPQPQHRMC